MASKAGRWFEGMEPSRLRNHMHGFRGLTKFFFDSGILQLIQIGKFQTWLAFDNEWKIQVMSRCTVLENGKEISSYESESGWSNTEFQRLIELEFVGFEVISDEELALKLQGGFEVHLFDEEKMYESLMITGPNNIMVIV